MFLECASNYRHIHPKKRLSENFGNPMVSRSLLPWLEFGSLTMNIESGNDPWDHAARRLEKFLSELGVERCQMLEYLGEDAVAAHSALRNHVIPGGSKSRDLHYERNWYCHLDGQFFERVYDALKRDLRNDGPNV